MAGLVVLRCCIRAYVFEIAEEPWVLDKEVYRMRGELLAIDPLIEFVCLAQMVCPVT